MSLDLSNQIKIDSLLTSGLLSFRCLNDISLPTGVYCFHDILAYNILFLI